MRVSLCNEVIAELPFALQCLHARELGYDGIEIAPFTLAADPPRLSSTQRAELRRAAAAAGIAITGLHYILRAPQGLSITAADPAMRRRTVAVMRALCDLAADLGARLLVHGSPDQRRLEPGDEAEGRRRGIDSFAAIAPAAEQAGVVYCIEPLATDLTAFVNTVEEAVAIVRQIASPAVRTMVDCASAARTEREPVDRLIRRWLPSGLIGHIHLNDPNGRGPGDGTLDFASIMAALADGAYSGDAAIEPFIYEPDGPTCAARNIRYIRGILNRARK